MKKCSSTMKEYVKKMKEEKKGTKMEVSKKENMKNKSKSKK